MIDYLYLVENPTSGEKLLFQDAERTLQWLTIDPKWVYVGQVRVQDGPIYKEPEND